LNGSIRWKDYNVFDLIFHTTAEALCFVKKLAKFFTTMFHLTSFYGNGGTKFPKIAERQLSQALSSPLEGQYGESGKAPAVGISFCRTATLLPCNLAAVIQPTDNPAPGCPTKWLPQYDSSASGHVPEINHEQSIYAAKRITKPAL
jgi:hypothetical protein